MIECLKCVIGIWEWLSRGLPACWTTQNWSTKMFLFIWRLPGTVLRLYLGLILVALAIFAVLALLARIGSPRSKFKYYAKFIMVYYATLVGTSLLGPIFALRPRNVANTKWDNASPFGTTSNRQALIVIDWLGGCVWLLHFAESSAGSSESVRTSWTWRGRCATPSTSPETEAPSWWPTISRPSTSWVSWGSIITISLWIGPGSMYRHNIGLVEYTGRLSAASWH